MLAAYIEGFEPEDPVAAVRVGERPEPEPPPGWVVVEVRAAALNHHDLWSARGVGLKAEALPMILGMDASGIGPDGSEVVVHGLINAPGWQGPELLDPGISGLSERHQGTFAQRVTVPERNLVPKPPTLSFAEAACLPTAWLTAYGMLFVDGDVKPGQRILVQGSSGGVATALIKLASSAGIEVWVTGRSAEKRAYALEMGASAAFAPGERLPARVDAVMETVGAATWAHSLRSLRKGGIVVVAGATSGYVAETPLAHVFARKLRIAGTTMASREDLDRLAGIVERRGIRPEIHVELPLENAPEAFARMAAGDVRGKIVLVPPV